MKEKWSPFPWLPQEKWVTHSLSSHIICCFKNGMIHFWYISMIYFVLVFFLPPKSDLFQRDLYPDTAALEPALQADQWIAGQDASPLRVSLSGGYTAPGSKHKDTQPSKPQLTSQDSGPPTGSVAAARPSSAAKEPEEDVQHLQVVAKDTDGNTERPKREVGHHNKTWQ